MTNIKKYKEIYFSRSGICSVNLQCGGGCCATVIVEVCSSYIALGLEKLVRILPEGYFQLLWSDPCESLPVWDIPKFSDSRTMKFSPCIIFLQIKPC